MNSEWWRKWHAFWECYKNKKNKQLWWINSFLILKGASLWGKQLVVAAPLWLPNPRNSKTSGHKSNEAQIASSTNIDFWFSVDDHNSMFGPWLNISGMFDKVEEVIAWLPLVPLGIQYWFLSGWLLIGQPTPDVEGDFHWSWHNYNQKQKLYFTSVITKINHVTLLLIFLICNHN